MEMATNATNWSNTVKERDGYCCQSCGRVRDETTRIVAHHIVSRDVDPKLKLSLENGKTLCKSCHGKVHAGPHSFERVEAFVSLYKMGYTEEEIGWVVGLSKQRISQLLAKTATGMRQGGGKGRKGAYLERFLIRHPEFLPFLDTLK